jgi:hypothetical protein
VCCAILALPAAAFQLLDSRLASSIRPTDQPAQSSAVGSSLASGDLTVHAMPVVPTLWDRAAQTSGSTAHSQGGQKPLGGYFIRCSSWCSTADVFSQATIEVTRPAYFSPDCMLQLPKHVDFRNQGILVLPVLGSTFVLLVLSGFSGVGVACTEC